MFWYSSNYLPYPTNPLRVWFGTDDATGFETKTKLPNRDIVQNKIVKCVKCKKCECVVSRGYFKRLVRERVPKASVRSPVAASSSTIVVFVAGQ